MTNIWKPGSHVLVVNWNSFWLKLNKADRHRILDGCKRFASYNIKEKLKIKVAKWGTPKKKIIIKLTGRSHPDWYHFIW
jgi:hypothetical protein